MGYKKTFKRYWKAKQNEAKHKKLRRLEFAHAYAVDRNRIKKHMFKLLSKEAKSNATAINLHRMIYEAKVSGGAIYKDNYISLTNSKSIAINGKYVKVKKIELKLSGNHRPLKRYSQSYKLWLAINYIDYKHNKETYSLDF